MARYRFGVFELDAESGELTRNSRKVRLRPQPCAVLLHLIGKPGELVTRADLQRRLWPEGTHVRFDQGLNSCIKQVRAALGDNPQRPRYIETLSRRGYRFIMRLETVETLHLAAPHVRVVVTNFRIVGDERTLVALGEGLRDEITIQLTQWASDGVSVAAGDSFREPEADFLVTGSIRVSGSSFRVAARLVQAADQRTIWGASFDGSLNDVLHAQSEIAAAITQSVVIRFQDPRATFTPPPLNARALRVDPAVALRME